MSYIYRKKSYIGFFKKKKKRKRKRKNPLCDNRCSSILTKVVDLVLGKVYYFYLGLNSLYPPKVSGVFQFKP